MLGSLKKQLECLKCKALEFKDNGYEVLALKLSNIKNNENGFIIFKDDISDNPIIIESDFIEKCLQSESIIVCNENGYKDIIDYFTKLNNVKELKSKLK